MKASSRDNRRGRALPVLLRDAGTSAYATLSLLAWPLILWRKWRRFRALRLRSEFDPARWNISFGPQAQPQRERDSDAPNIVFIGVGWGEVAALKPLVEAVRHARPHVRCTLSVLHHEALPDAVQLSDSEVLPVPFDSLVPVARWVDRAQADVVVIFERFQYPLLLRALWLHRTPIVILHARLRHAAKRGGVNLAFKRWQLRGVSAICFAHAALRDSALPLFSPSTQTPVTGSIKFPSARPQLPPERESALLSWIQNASGDSPLLVAGSTRGTDEEAFILDAWEIVCRDLPPELCPALMIAPRHPPRADEVESLAQSRGLNVSRRSQSATQTGRAPILLLDTLGELGRAYGCGVGSFVGGTVQGDTQNIAEPLVWGIPVAYGMRRGNYANEQQACEAASVGFRVASPEELAFHWTALLRDAAWREDLRTRALHLVEEQRGAFERVLEIVLQSVDAA